MSKKQSSVKAPTREADNSEATAADLKDLDVVGDIFFREAGLCAKASDAVGAGANLWRSSSLKFMAALLVEVAALNHKLDRLLRDRAG